MYSSLSDTISLEVVLNEHKHDIEGIFLLDCMI